mgnify:FL=1
MPLSMLFSKKIEFVEIAQNSSFTIAKILTFFALFGIMNKDIGDQLGAILTQSVRAGVSGIKRGTAF